MPLRILVRRIQVPPDQARRKFLVLFGIAYLLIGFSYVTVAPDAPAARALSWLPDVPFWALGAGWMLAGFVAVAFSFAPTCRDKPGFMALSIAPSAWTVLWAATAVLPLFGGPHAPRSWVSVVIFGVIAGAVDVVSGMVDAAKVAEIVKVAGVSE